MMVTVSDMIVGAIINPIIENFVELNIAAGAAIGFMLAVRKPARRIFGAHAVYLLWAIVPIAAAATFIPARAIETLSLGMALEEIVALTSAPSASAFDVALPYALFAIWLIGAITMATALIRRQTAFMRDADLGLAGPAIVGFAYPRIVTPSDFKHRYSEAERKLILTHEQVHIDRNDARINAVIALMRCLFWFNPMIHIGAKAMRIDQELSCDAEVIDRRPRVRRAYAETLLKTQLASRPLPVGCYWPAESQHPLTERIDMLARKPLSNRRRAAATAIVLALSAGAGVAAWAAQPERTIVTEEPDVLVPFSPLTREQAKDPLVRIRQEIDRQPVDTRPRPAASFTMPDYPAESQTAREEGNVIVELCVASTGIVEDVKLAKTSGFPRLDAATVTGLRGSQFQPATREGKAVRLCGYNLTVGWSLDNTPP